MFHVSVHTQKFISSLCTYKIKNFVSPFCTHITVFKLQKKYFSYVQTTKKPRHKPRLIIRNVLYTSFMNSLLNIKNRVISYTLSVIHRRCLFCSVGIFVIFRIILCIIFTFYFFNHYWSTSFMTSSNIPGSKLVFYYVRYCFPPP